MCRSEASAASSGKCSSSSNKAKSLYAGQKVYSHQEVVLENNRSYLSLVSPNGGTAQISKKGKYKVAYLAAKLAKMKTSVSSRYASFIISNLSKSATGNIQQQRYKYMNVVGAVNRGAHSALALNVVLESVNKFINPKVTLTWKKLVGVERVIISITNEGGEQLNNAETELTQFTLNLADDRLKDAGALTFKIKTIGTKKLSAKCELLLVPNDGKLKGFLKKNRSGNNPADILEKAFWEEQTSGYVKASETYEQAIKAANNNEAYHTAYHHFLIRHQIGDYEKYLKK